MCFISLCAPPPFVFGFISEAASHKGKSRRPPCTFHRKPLLCCCCCCCCRRGCRCCCSKRLSCCSSCLHRVTCCCCCKVPRHPRPVHITFPAVATRGHRCVGTEGCVSFISSKKRQQRPLCFSPTAPRERQKSSPSIPVRCSTAAAAQQQITPYFLCLLNNNTSSSSSREVYVHLKLGAKRVLSERDTATYAAVAAKAMGWAAAAGSAAAAAAATASSAGRFCCCSCSSTARAAAGSRGSTVAPIQRPRRS